MHKAGGLADSARACLRHSSLKEGASGPARLRTGGMASGHWSPGQPSPARTWPGAALKWALEAVPLRASGRGEPSDVSPTQWVQRAGDRSDFTPSPLAAPRAHPGQRLSLKAHSKAHLRSAEAIEPLDPWQKGQREGTFINTVLLSQVTVMATTGTRSAPREESQKSPTSRDPTQDTPPHPWQNQRAQSTDLSRRREPEEKLTYHHR